MGRSSSRLCLAAAAVGIAWFIAIPGCLNPRPEELPSTLDVEPIAADPVAGPGPVRETCSDNPYLAGCAAPDEGVSNPASSAPEAAPAPQAPGFVAVGDAGSGTQADAGAVSDPEADPSSGASP
jgi:hypothetical protein